MNDGIWIYYETDSEGNKIGDYELRTDRLSNVRIRVALVCPEMLTRKFNHFAELAHAGRSGPGVDMTHWKGEGEARRMVFSARLRYSSLTLE